MYRTVFGEDEITARVNATPVLGRATNALVLEKKSEATVKIGSFILNC